MTGDQFIRVPETALPSGLVVPSFEVGKFLCGAAVDGGAPIISAGADPWTMIGFHDAMQACTSAGWTLLSESQWLAIAWDLCRQNINWTGCTFGAGKLRQGLRKGNAPKPVCALYQSSDPGEERWKVMSNGAAICDFGGNAYQWLIDDIQGDLDGTSRTIEMDSPSVTTAPMPRLTSGMGWRPTDRRDIPGRALCRGGSWRSGKDAGAFCLWFAPAMGMYKGVGFRAARAAQGVLS